MLPRKNNFVLFCLLGLFFASCSKNCKKEAESVNDEKENTELVVTQKEEAQPAQDLSALNYKELNQQQKNDINKLFGDEICPCGCPTTFAQCIQDNTCPAADLLAQWAIDQLNQGAPQTSLFKAVSEEINSGFGSQEKTINLSSAWQKGNKNAPVKIVEFADFECPACKMVYKELKSFSQNNNNVEVYFMHFPLSNHPNAERAAIASEAAGKLGYFWQMHDELFSYQGTLSDENINSIALKIFPKKMDEFKKHLKDPQIAKKVKAQKEYALNDLGVMSTPSLYFNGKPYNLIWSKDTFALRVQMEELYKKSKCKKADAVHE